MVSGPNAGSASAAPRAASIDQRELDYFERLGADWWRADGPMAALHKFNPTRIRWLRDRITDHFGKPENEPIRVLSNVSLLDIGCGGGLLSEPLARLGAKVTGIDPAPGNVDIARHHAEAGGISIDYRAVTAEELAASGAQFDVVCAMEVIEHVVNPAAFIAVAAKLVRPGGLLFAATLNRTLKSFALAIVGAEYVLRWVEPGTHQWEKFIKPAELEDWIFDAGLDVTERTGVVYNPLRDAWSESRDMDVNYMLMAERVATR
ncbi:MULTISPECIES: bifunctional 2-polyprenyl-6-hydroxyphenol methylase/3-demethylubiquinol 3-O-methyltransferase UbiG [unclassified Beijerinckia]|uniref:bifunctional 2-polyprenyl-6-hydroxyphenol methylase/3-demethylubiquinol 3-O-methyltransferase UbiG n=1 Tax=unclassified Beijerinckia TaxID=2638183 RepID=UPI000896D3BD|nr:MULTISPECIES: bifunctional 2-polyprenyl-6-hydroxyphenol methylase/3-demethylubiquinol 3-O-methyltransferase UbiG [unclassified Beijerinckia]MDH7798439.1 2-polyprenyl-6-hydroxyphenyl methylase/3-demethylubiquinone-9 3-methyltransferase [Beijerinckia sp. GAS462]SED20926.1 3-demethylubiquinone-9 3-methyltransferase [Beijerinckia sp. 28-YEA-48]